MGHGLSILSTKSLFNNENHYHILRVTTSGDKNGEIKNGNYSQCLACVL